MTLNWNGNFLLLSNFSSNFFQFYNSINMSSSTSSVMASITKRLAALEAQVTILKAENEALKNVTPLAAITAGLHAASAEDIQAWMEICQEVAASYGDLAAPSSNTPSKKVKASKKATTNNTGPEAFNKEVRAAWIGLLQAAGVEINDDADGDAVKKAAKTAGISYQDAMQEASRLRHIAQLVDAGKTPEEAAADYERIAADRAAKNAARKAKHAEDGASTTSSKPAASKKVAAAKVSTASSKPKATSSTKPKATSSKKAAGPTAEELEFIALMADAGMSVLEVSGTKYWLEADSSKVFEYGNGGDMGACVGLYDADTAEIVGENDDTESESNDDE